MSNDASTSARLPIIDAWAQPAFPHLFHRVPEIERLFQQSGATALLAAGVTPEQMIAQMDAAGIERALLCAWHRPGGWIVTNDEIAELVRAYPDRFSGMAAVDLEKPVAAARELERVVRELGFIALRVIPWLWNRPPNDKLYYPLYVQCVELGIPFCTQVGHTGPLMPSEPGRPIPYIDEIALAFPELTIVGGHIGYPWTDEMIALAWKHANVYIDTSAYLPRYYPPQLLHFMQTYGRDKVLFGTNFPMLDFERCASQARQLPLPPENAGKFLADNARRVFRLPGSAAPAK
jgi:predicted TIM-barrel fold metal-dependent hydrolase